MGGRGEGWDAWAGCLCLAVGLSGRVERHALGARCRGWARMKWSWRSCKSRVQSAGQRTCFQAVGGWVVVLLVGLASIGALGGLQQASWAVGGVGKVTWRRWQRRGLSCRLTSPVQGDGGGGVMVVSGRQEGPLPRRYSRRSASGVMAARRASAPGPRSAPIPQCPRHAAASAPTWLEPALVMICVTCGTGSTTGCTFLLMLRRRRCSSSSLSGCSSGSGLRAGAARRQICGGQGRVRVEVGGLVWSGGPGGGPGGSKQHGRRAGCIWRWGRHRHAASWRAACLPAVRPDLASPTLRAMSSAMIAKSMQRVSTYSTTVAANSMHLPHTCLQGRRSGGRHSRPPL
jgi:hypothetical protein